MMLALTIALTAVCAGQPEPAGGVSVSVRIEPPEFPFHRRTDFTIAVEGPKSMTADFPQMAGKFGGLDVSRAPVRNTERLGGGRVRISETYGLEALWAGYYAIPPVTVRVSGVEGLEDGAEFIAPSPMVHVRPLTPEETAAAERFTDIAPIVYPPVPAWKTWWFWIGAAALAAVVAAGAWFVLRRRKRSTAAERHALPWETAYARLQALDAKRLPEAGLFGPYYVELSDILRRYLEERFDLHAPERTTPEFLSEVSTSGVLDESYQRHIGGFLRHCDRVKFAQYEPSQEQMEESFTTVLTFVDQTMPRATGDEGKDSAASAPIGGAA